jgi:hypothetical protein
MDRVSIGNAIIIQNSALYPVFIDPQNQGFAWLKRLKGRSLRVVKWNAE